MYVNLLYSCMQIFLMYKYWPIYSLTHKLVQCSQSEVIEKLERLGQRVGESLVERTSRDTPRFRTELDAVVFICKQFWSLAFNKQVDNLKTNHQVKNYFRS